MHQTHRPVPNSQGNEICLNISQKHWVINVCLLGLAVLPSVFLHSTPSFDLSFEWIVDQSSPTTCRRSTQNQSQTNVGSPEDSYLYLSATEEKLIANKTSNGSFLAHQYANKKKLQKRLLQAFFGRFNKVNWKKRSRRTI